MNKICINVKGENIRITIKGNSVSIPMQDLYSLKECLLKGGNYGTADLFSDDGIHLRIDSTFFDLTEEDYKVLKKELKKIHEPEIPDPVETYRKRGNMILVFEGKEQMAEWRILKETKNHYYVWPKRSTGYLLPKREVA